MRRRVRTEASQHLCSNTLPPLEPPTQELNSQDLFEQLDYSLKLASSLSVLSSAVRFRSCSGSDFSCLPHSTAPRGRSSVQACVLEAKTIFFSFSFFLFPPSPLPRARKTCQGGPAALPVHALPQCHATSSQNGKVHGKPQLLNPVWRPLLAPEIRGFRGYMGNPGADRCEKKVLKVL